MTRYIAIDWGSTNLRAWYYRAGECVDERRSEAGVTRLDDRTPAQVFATITDGWPVAEVPVIMAGMVGSNAGWLAVPYLACPVALNALSDRLTCVEGKAWIVPGLSVERDDNYNVMRGEETQLLGAVTLQPAPLYVMPGTHAKWVQMEQDRVIDFRTVMTGELHHLLLKQSLIGAGLPAQEASPDAFRDGLQIGSHDPSTRGAVGRSRCTRPGMGGSHAGIAASAGIRRNGGNSKGPSRPGDAASGAAGQGRPRRTAVRVEPGRCRLRDAWPR